MSLALEVAGSLNRSEKRFVNKAKKFVIFSAGLAIQEQKITTLTGIHRKIVPDFCERAEKFNPCHDEMMELFEEECRPAFLTIFVNNLIGEKVYSGDYLWKTYKNIKSEFINHWMPHFIIKSGETEKDALIRVCKHVWAYRTNKKNRLANAKLAPGEPKHKADYSYLEAPDITPQNAPLELATFAFYRKHPLVSPTKNAISTVDMVAGSDANANDGILAPTANHIGDDNQPSNHQTTTFELFLNNPDTNQASVTAKGVESSKKTSGHKLLASRAAQRIAEKDGPLKKKQRMTPSATMMQQHV